MSQNKKGRGGSRKNSGAKKKYGEPTKTVSFRVPESKANEVKKYFKTMLANWLQNGI
jgi:hypothetical protein